MMQRARPRAKRRLKHKNIIQEKRKNSKNLPHLESPIRRHKSIGGATTGHNTETGPFADEQDLRPNTRFLKEETK